MPSAPAAARLGPARTQAAALAVGAVAGCAVLALADPGEGGLYPRCPTQVLLGMDCPACGTLRGAHALLRGRPGQALDHNLLLVLAVPFAGLVWLSLVARALGRPVALPRVPSWVVPVVVAVAIAFTIVRNLGPGGLAWLDSAA